MTDKFKVGDKVYDIQDGMGIIHKNNDCDGHPHRVWFSPDFSREYTNQGRRYSTDINPTLLTVAEARAKGYDVPKVKKVKKDTVKGKYPYTEIATVTYEWEEEI